jgi:hypothetical protein
MSNAGKPERNSRFDQLVERFHQQLDEGAFPGNINAFPVGGGKGFKAPTGKGVASPLRWGYGAGYSFSNVNAAIFTTNPFAEVGYFQSAMLVSASMGRPLRWHVHAQFTFDEASAWGADTNDWVLQVVTQPGVGQSNPTVFKTVQYVPSTGVVTTFFPDPLAQATVPFAPIDVDFVLPAAALYVQLTISGVAPVDVSTAQYTGQLNAWAAPYFAMPGEIA